jgi:hypothetical protein
LLHADGQTDMTKLIVTFRNFVNAPKKEDELEDYRSQGSRNLLELNSVKMREIYFSAVVCCLFFNILILYWIRCEQFKNNLD